MKSELEIIDMQEEGYKPLVDFEAWRVAVLKYCEDVRIENIKTMQRHDETDEVFVLLEGECTLITGEKVETSMDFRCEKMEKNKIYNVKRGAWHNHVLSENGSVLIVENVNTTDGNSPIINLTENEIKVLRKKSKTCYNASIHEGKTKYM